MELILSVVLIWNIYTQLIKLILHKYHIIILIDHGPNNDMGSSFFHFSGFLDPTLSLTFSVFRVPP